MRARDPEPREIRALVEDGTIVVYQAFSSAIADAALEAGTFVLPFRRNRMTWIKPSFLWMMHRSNWAQAPNQERVLAVTLTLDGWWWALSHAALSSFDPRVHDSVEIWKEQLGVSPVRVQWDPDRSVLMEPLPQRAIQVGLGGPAVARYVDEWIVGLSDVTVIAHQIHSAVQERRYDAAIEMLPSEEPLAVPDELRTRLGAHR